MVVDIEKCCGCYACFLSCRDEFFGKDRLPTAAAQAVGQRWLNIEELEHGEGDKVKVDYFPKLCLHCDEPACAKGAPAGAVYKREDGVVVIDPLKAVGAKSIADNCPYGAVIWNEERRLPQKCTFCAHMLDEGEKVTRCVECCPTGALVFGDLNDPTGEIATLMREKADRIEARAPERGVAVRYMGIPRPFLAGELAYADRPGEPAAGAEVKLLNEDGSLSAVCRTDCFGDFEFKGLRENRKYRIVVDRNGYEAYEAEFRPNASINLGTIVIAKKGEK
jgi:Fe-S-cluster-containing dehydrogenase component